MNTFWDIVGNIAFMAVAYHVYKVATPHGIWRILYPISVIYIIAMDTWNIFDPVESIYLQIFWTIFFFIMAKVMVPYLFGGWISKLKKAFTEK